jgi:hypothetical protein
MLIKLELTDEQRQELIFASREAAMATARLWDVLRGIENAHTCCIENVDEFVASIAGELSIPPDMTALDPTTVMDAFHALTKVTSDTVSTTPHS